MDGKRKYHDAFEPSHIEGLSDYSLILFYPTFQKVQDTQDKKVII